MKPTVYIETSIVSYLTAWPSRDLIVAGHQQITHEWWSQIRPEVQCLISPYVIDEASQGDREAAQKRLEAIVGFPILTLNEEIKALAQKYQTAVQIPEKAKLDAFHLAFPAWYKIDYLLTWNCKHIANATVRKIIESLNRQLNIHTPVICTPEEFMEVQSNVE
ncbi:MAG: type II toxin-antitoxin system VapC family toxin [candidate division KSB1 bacterium]|nr:type II toxin-antitoxin system VapC family toxin [candidate division KSB1 bacterium]MDZ7365901.1 type II toxin-antitoxin system VapC family toxin [candidate division KSB1 bacterium]MDZ7403865.1 type II toxin-antitoxin system VapC family toxin [candidate division KSB1 bacterium]